MTFTAPLPWTQVLRMIAGWQAMPTDQGSAALSTLPGDIRALSLFSARTTNADYLEQVRKQVADLADGKTNMATVKMHLQQWLRDHGYSAEKGFPSGSAGVPPATDGVPPATDGVPPATDGVPPAASELQNLASDKRIELVVKTLAGRAVSTAHLQDDMTDDARFNYPCWKFTSIGWRRKHRGMSGRDNDPSWNERWVRSGGTLYGPDENLMIARKDDPVWEKISDSGLWPDGLDSDTDPVVFNTSYVRLNVPRKKCIALGVIDANENVAAHNISLIGSMFDDPAKATLADIAAKGSALMEALQMLKEAA